MSKYKQQVQDMITAHKDLFESFKKIHDNYANDPKTWQDKFNEEGQEVLHIMRRFENNLCAKSESGKYGKFSGTLADKFWAEIRAVFPQIDNIGMSV